MDNNANVMQSYFIPIEYSSISSIVIIFLYG